MKPLTWPFAVDQSLADHYQEIAQENRRARYPRFLVYQPQDSTGWGNRLRGLNMCFTAALAMRRVLICNDPTLLSFFDSPFTVDWSLFGWSRYIKRYHPEIIPAHLTPDNFSRSEWAEWETEDLNRRFEAPLLVHVESTSFDDALRKNPHYQSLWSSLYPPGLDRRITMNVALLCSKPRAAVRGLIKRNLSGYPEKFRKVIAIQFRQFVDSRNENQGHAEDFLSRIQEFLSSKDPGEFEVFITSDSQNFVEQATKVATGFNVTIGSRTFVHTGNEKETELQRLWRRFREKMGFYKAGEFRFRRAGNSKAIRRRIMNSVLDWYRISAAKIVISNFTSYAISAVAASGETKVLYMIDGKKGYAGPLEPEMFRI